MNTNDFKDLNYNWDAERAYRLRIRRNRAMFALWNDLFYAALALAAIALIVLLCYKVARQPVEERAAYLEGRWGLDHRTAMAYAEVGEMRNEVEVKMR